MHFIYIKNKCFQIIANILKLINNSIKIGKIHWLENIYLINQNLHSCVLSVHPPVNSETVTRIWTSENNWNEVYI